LKTGAIRCAERARSGQGWNGVEAFMVSGSFEEPVSLRKLWPAARLIGAEDIKAISATSDWTRVRPGEVFVAVQGSKSDGHYKLHEALKRGAAAVVVERPVPELPVPQCLVPDSKQALAELCHALAGNPSSELIVVGVLGAYGKSTTATFIHSALELAGLHAGLISSIRWYDGRRTIAAPETTPGPEALAQLLKQMLAAGCFHVVLELSAPALAEQRVWGVRFNSLVFTNSCPEPPGCECPYHAGGEHRAQLFARLEPGAVAVLNADDPESELLIAQTAASAVTYGVQAEADFNARHIQVNRRGGRFAVTCADGCHVLNTLLLGRHNVFNALAAASALRLLGLEWETIWKGIATVQTMPGRLEPIRRGQPFGLFVDNACRPQTLAVTLESLRQIYTGKIICVFSAGGVRGAEQRRRMAEAAERFADMVVLTADEHCLGAMGEAAAGFSRIHALAIEPDRGEAIRLALSVAGPDDCVLIAGGRAGTRPGEIRSADDKRLVSQFLDELFAGHKATGS